jgi:hypothetical protein
VHFAYSLRANCQSSWDTICSSGDRRKGRLEQGSLVAVLLA